MWHGVLPGGAVGVGCGSVLEVLGEEASQDPDRDLGSVLNHPVSCEAVQEARVDKPMVTKKGNSY